MLFFGAIIIIMLVTSLIADTNTVSDINNKCKDFDMAVITAKDEFISDFNSKCVDAKSYAMDKALLIDCAARINRRAAMVNALKRGEDLSTAKAICPPAFILGLVNPDQFAKLAA